MGRGGWGEGLAILIWPILANPFLLCVVGVVVVVGVGVGVGVVVVIVVGLDHPTPDRPAPDTCTFDDPRASNTTKIPREDTQRETKRAKMEAGGKKREILGPSPFGAPPFGAPP